MVDAPLNIVVLAAGQGKRMCSQKSKVLHEIAGRSMLAHVLASARSLLPNKLIVVHGFDGDRVKAEISEDDVIWVEQRERLGTGHAVLQAVPYLEGGITLILYGDVPFISGRTLKDLVQLCDGDQMSLLTAIINDPAGYGRIVRGFDGKVSQIVEHKDANAQILEIKEVNTGFMAIPTCCLKEWLGKLNCNNSQGEYYLTDIIAMAGQSGLGIGTMHPSDLIEITGVNDKVQLAQLEREYQRKNAFALMESGVQLADPNRIDVRGTLVCGKDVYIDVNCVFEGEVRLGDGVCVGPFNLIKDATILDNTRIEPHCHLVKCFIGKDAVVGPYARLRPNTQIEDSVRIGNFVEVKASHIGLGSKVNHLSYIGDAEIGEGVNVGAGTVTCNYDGVNKHKTVIQDKAFIGSGTMLVAPVQVGSGATVGAGSTITDSVEAGDLAIARSRQINIAHWESPFARKKQ